MAERAGKVTEHVAPTGAGTHKFTVGGKKVAVWATLKRDGMEVTNPALRVLLDAIEANGTVILGGYEKDEEYQGRSFKRFYATEAQPAPEGVSTGSQVASNGQFVGREPGAFDKTTMARWAISAAIDAKAAGITIDDELLANAAQLFVAQLELAKEKTAEPAKVEF